MSGLMRTAVSSLRPGFNQESYPPGNPNSESVPKIATRGWHRRLRRAATLYGILAASLSLRAFPVQTGTGELLAEAQQAIDSGRHEEAAVYLRSALERDPWNMPARSALVDVLMRLMRWPEAQQELTFLRKHFPGEATVSFLAAAVAFRRGDFKQAADFAGEALGQDENLADAYRIRALSRFMIQDYEGFLSDLHSLIAKDPGNPEPHYHLGRYYYERQLFTESLAAFQKALAVDPGHYRSHYFLGWCQQARGDLGQAETSYRKAIEIIEAEHISYGWPYSDLGDLLTTLGKADEGLEWLKRATGNDPDLPYTHYKYASALFKFEQTEAVEALLLNALRLDPGYTEAYYLLGRYYQKKGDREKAREAFAQFQQLRKNPRPSPFGLRR